MEDKEINAMNELKVKVTEALVGYVTKKLEEVDMSDFIKEVEEELKKGGRNSSPT